MSRGTTPLIGPYSPIALQCLHTCYITRWTGSYRLRGAAMLHPHLWEDEGQADGAAAEGAAEAEGDDAFW